MIVIIDYGMGNIASILNMFKKIGVNEITISSDIEVISKADKIILPGVGSFDNGMINLNKSNLIPILNQKILTQKIPVLGICLGMQLLTKSSEEGKEKGLCWIDAYTKKFNLENDSNLKVPHMGWNYVSVKKTNPLLKLNEKARFYFVHSYYVLCKSKEHILLETNYGQAFTSAIQKDNIFGVQFHPEKSHQFGMKLLNNFAKI